MGYPGPGRLGVAERNHVKRASYRDFKRGELAPRSPAGAETFTAVYTRPPRACPVDESARKDPRPEEKSLPIRKKKAYLYIYICY